MLTKNINDDTQEMSQSHEHRLSEAPKERRGTYDNTINTMHEITDAQTKKDFNRGTSFEGPILLARNPALNSDAAPNYKYMIGPHRGPLPHL